jgi:transcription antitermination factor NusG
MLQNIKTTKNWNALYVNSRAEKKVCEALQCKNIEAYIPVVKTMRQWSDRKQAVELPLINGYVFVCIAMPQRDTVLQTKGVVSFVKHCGAIAVVQEKEIEQLKQLIELGYHLEANRTDYSFKEGEKVKINSGPFKNFEGYVLGKNQKTHFEVSLASIGYSIKVKLPQELLDYAS